MNSSSNSDHVSSLHQDAENNIVIEVHVDDNLGKIPSIENSGFPQNENLLLPKPAIHEASSESLIDQKSETYTLNSFEPISEAPVNKSLRIQDVVQTNAWKVRCLLVSCWLAWGGGFFIVSIPSAIGLGADDDWIVNGFSIAIGRTIGLFITLWYFGLLRTTCRGLPRDVLSIRAYLVLSAPLLITLGFILYDVMLKQGGNISVLASATSLFVAIPIAFGIFVLKEKVSLKKIVGMLLGLGAVLLLTFSGGVSGSGETNTETPLTAIFLLIGTILAWGVPGAITSAAGRVLSWSHLLIMLFYGQTLQLAMIFIALTATSQFPNLNDRSTLIKTMGQLIASFGYILFVKLTSERDVALYATLTSLYVVVPIILGIAIFNEEVNALSGIGFAVTLVSVLLLSE